MIEEGLWKTRAQRRKRIQQPRHRRDCFGELVQIDGCEHHWFEERGPKCTLLVYIDDATSRLMELRFVDSESTFDHFHATRRYLERYGKPVAFYSDKHPVFRVNQTGATSGSGLTRFGRALHDLNSDILYANSAQAKGRVEHLNQTLQGRLVKELRLEGTDNQDEANAFLLGFMERFNTKFARSPANETDLHRPLTERDDLEGILCWQEERTVSNSLTLQYDKVLFILEPNEITRPLARQRVTIFDYPDGRFVIKHQGRELPDRIFDKVQQVDQAAIVENKRLGPVLAYIAERQKQLGESRSKKAPRRGGQAKSIFKVG